MTKRDGQRVAADFLALNLDEFRMFWAVLAVEWKQEDGDLEAQWFYNGQHMRPSESIVIGAMHSAIASGMKAARK